MMMKFPWSKEKPQDLPLEARFEEEFGVSPKAATPEQVMKRILGRYDQLSEYEYLRVWRVNTWGDFTRLKTLYGQILKAATGAAQPFVQEDLSFIANLGQNPNMLDDSSLLASPDRNWVTKEQADVVLGKITLKK
jgi:hypothetical protein